MSEVYFSKNIEGIIENIDFTQLGQKVGIKVHFGEEGCDTFISADLIKKFYQKIEDLGKDVTLIECNVLYKGSRTNSTDHIETAKRHGFGDMKIDILDGERGDEFIDFDGCKIGKGLEKYDSLLILSHFKGHGAVGFGGAIKNVGMGLGSRAGKLDMHSSVKPVVSDKCIACAECVRHCDVDAITIEKGQAVINDDLCVGCAMCIAVCPFKAMKIPWEGRSSKEVQERIAEYARAILKRFSKTIFVNILANITEHCDCKAQKQELIMEDIGVLYSDNSVAIDMASLDLVNKKSSEKFEEINEADNKYQIDIAEEKGLGSQGYELINL